MELPETDPVAIRASRLFAGPGQYQPQEFAAYGILAFQSEATSSSRDRYIAICEGFLASLPPSIAVRARGIPLNQQMATVWPLSESELARELNDFHSGTPLFARCGEIVDKIDTIASGTALHLATIASESHSLDGDGPYLLAWSPSSDYGQDDAKILVSDFSNVENVDQATRRFVDWRLDIQQKPELWNSGWNVEKLRIVIAELADKYGSAVLFFLGMEDA